MQPLEHVRISDLSSRRQESLANHRSRRATRGVISEEDIIRGKVEDDSSREGEAADIDDSADTTPALSLPRPPSPRNTTAPASDIRGRSTTTSRYSEVRYTGVDRSADQRKGAYVVCEPPRHARGS